jgi:hypothetical protein
MQDLAARLEKCLAYFQGLEQQDGRVANYLDNMQIGFYRSVPGVGTWYSLNQCYTKWQLLETQ